MAVPCWVTCPIRVALTPAGPIPLTFEIHAQSLSEAVAKFAEGAQKAFEETMEELKELRRQSSSSIVVPSLSRTSTMPPWKVNPESETPVEFRTRSTNAPSLLASSVALPVATRETSVAPSTTTSSSYFPFFTSIVSSVIAASTAAWIVGNCSGTRSVSAAAGPARPSPSSATTAVTTVARTADRGSWASLARVLGGVSAWCVSRSGLWVTAVMYVALFRSGCT